MHRCLVVIVTVFACAFFRAISPAGEKKDEAVDLAPVMEKYLQEETTWQEREELGAKFKAAGAAAAPVMLKAIQQPGQDINVAFSLIRMLGEIPEPAAVNALIEITRAGGRPAHKALNALGAMGMPEADVYLLNFTPPDDNTREVLAISLDKVPGPKATSILVGYLADPNKIVSARARQTLTKRFRRDEVAGAEQMLSDLFRKLLRSPRDEWPPHVYDDVIRTCAALPDEDGIDFVEDCFDDPRPEFRQAALHLLQKKPSLAAHSDLEKSMAEWIDEEQNATTLKALLDILKRSRVRRAALLAIPCLDKEDRSVRIKATEVLGTLSGKNLGRNPETWKTWLDEHQGELLEEER